MSAASAAIARHRGLLLAVAGLAGALALGVALLVGPGGGMPTEPAAAAPAAPRQPSAARAGLGTDDVAVLGVAPAPSRLSAPTAISAVSTVSDDLPQAEPAPREGTEAAAYARFLELGRQADGSLSAEAARLFADGSTFPENERIALLRALWDTGAPDAGRWFLCAIATPGERERPEAAVPDFAVGFLARRAAREPAAVAVLSEAVASSPPECDAGRLARAAAALRGVRTDAPSEEP
jgi:hypothetical protein